MGRGKKVAENLDYSKKVITFARKCITNEMQSMIATVVRKPASFRLRADLLEKLRRNAARENRTLNNYVESVLLDIVYEEPNKVTSAAIEEAMSRKSYPDGELYNSAEEMFKALNEELDAE